LGGETRAEPSLQFQPKGMGQPRRGRHRHVPHDGHWYYRLAMNNNSGAELRGGVGGIALQPIGSNAVQLWHPSFATSNKIVYH
jgi:hypothetical protein